MHNRRGAPQRLFLHVVLLACSVIFALPFVWLAGTSWKLDKELQRRDVTLLPLRPIPRARSPYIDERTFDMQAPEFVTREVWRDHTQPLLLETISARLKSWSDDRADALARADVRAELIEGAYDYLRDTIPSQAWTDESRLRSLINERLTDEVLGNAFARCYRYFAVGKVLLKDARYGIHDLTGERSADSIWKVTEGSATLSPRSEAGQPIGVVAYDLSRTDRFTLTADLESPVAPDDVKRIDVSFRRDQTWHELSATLEFGGVKHATRSPKYLGEDTWWDVQFQRPSIDDDRLIPKTYVLIDPVDEGPQYDHGDRTIRVSLTVTRSGMSEALWAKGTENYRKVFAEVPFWRYLKTSTFLVIANILGTIFSCSLAAYALSRLNWPGRELAFVLVLATLMIPQQVTMIPSFVIYKQLGWYNTLAPLWAPAWLGVNAFAIFLLRQAMKGIPRDLEDAARIDGCGYARTFWHVALPEMKPTLAAISIFTFMYVWNDFMGPLIYVNDQGQYPLALGLFALMAGRENLFTLIMAGSLLMVLPVAITFFALQRFFIQGVTLSGMKG
jgi:ABC-type glycerol-3-phosphate transport system permease component